MSPAPLIPLAITAVAAIARTAAVQLGKILGTKAAKIVGPRIIQAVTTRVAGSAVAKKGTEKAAGYLAAKLGAETVKFCSENVKINMAYDNRTGKYSLCPSVCGVHLAKFDRNIMDDCKSAVSGFQSACDYYQDKQMEQWGLKRAEQPLLKHEEVNQDISQPEIEERQP